MLNFDENDEEIKTKGKLYAITALSVVGIIVVSITIGIFSIKSVFNYLFTKKEYFILNVDSKNRDKVIELFNKEKEAIFFNKNYCDSIYKIEYYNLFPDGREYTMYCKDEDNITFSIDKAGEDTLATYIYKNGKREIK